MNTSQNSTEGFTSSSRVRPGDLRNFVPENAGRKTSETPSETEEKCRALIGEYAWRLDEKVRSVFLAMLQRFDAEQEAALHRELARMGRRDAFKLLDGLTGRMGEPEPEELPG